MGGVELLEVGFIEAEFVAPSEAWIGGEQYP